LNHETARSCLPLGVSGQTQLAWTVYVLPYLELGALHNQFDMGDADYTVLAKNQPNMTRVNLYLCPSSEIERSNLTSANDEINGEKPFTTHYYGNLGPKGANPVSGNYQDNGQTAEQHGGYALQGTLLKDKNVRLASISDGTSSTILVGEASHRDGKRFRGWARGATLPQRVASGSCKNFVQPLNAGDPQKFNDGFFGSHHPQGANLLFCDGHVQFMADATDLKLLLSLSSRNGHEVASLPQ
jgi:prepilin-type processing-associated H-X9-DG protein